MSVLQISPLANAAACQPVAVGIDSLYVGYFLDGLGIDWERIAFEKEKLRSDPGASYAEYELGGETFALRRGARKPYSFNLTNSYFSIRLGKNIRPNCYVQFRSEALWQLGLDGALARFEAFRASINSLPTRPESVSRVDAAFDFNIGSPDFLEGHFLSQASKTATWREEGKLQTIQFGTSDVVCRVYDKVAEIEQESGKDWFFDLWGAKEGIWRAEFQVRGEHLKQAGIRTIDQMRAHLPKLVRELAQRHTSLRSPSKDKNKSRWPVHPMWRGVIESASRLVTPPSRVPPPLLTGRDYQLHRQLQSLMGDLKAVAAILSPHGPDRPVTLPELLSRLPSMLEAYHSPELWRADVLEKIRKRRLGL